MRIIISPAKKMNEDLDTLEYMSMPIFMEEAECIKDSLQKLGFEDLKKLWGCNEKIAIQNIERVKTFDLQRNLTPAILSYEGIQYQYMAPAVFESSMLDYTQKHLRILSGFYGVLKPMDGITPYRLEMQAKLAIKETKNLYEYWGRKIYDEVMDELSDESRIIINLASKEYSKCVEKYLGQKDRWITCVFGEVVDGKVVQKGTFAKMARGEMVRYMAEQQIEEPEKIKAFDRLGYSFNEAFSNEKEYVFIKS